MHTLVVILVQMKNLLAFFMLIINIFPPASLTSRLDSSLCSNQQTLVGEDSVFLFPSLFGS